LVALDDDGVAVAAADGDARVRLSKLDDDILVRFVFVDDECHRSPLLVLCALLISCGVSTTYRAKLRCERAAEAACTLAQRAERLQA
jgi:hypothetical protein